MRPCGPTTSGLHRHDADPLHYVNIPLQTNIYVPSQHCRKGLCIIAAIEHDRRVLADRETNHDDKAEALRFLIHFMGDLHQPLHDADNADRGGNHRSVNFLGHDTNLHKVWDGELIDSSGVDQESYFAYLRARMDSTRCHGARARHGRRLGDGGSPNGRVEDAYGRIPPNGHIGRGYLEANRPVIDSQLIAAGVRLAKVLNEALGGLSGPMSGWSSHPRFSHDRGERQEHDTRRDRERTRITRVHRDHTETCGTQPSPAS